MTEAVDIPRSPEIKTYPVKEVGHKIANLFDLYYKFGQITREKFAGIKGKGEEVQRSLWARMERVSLLRKLRRGEISHVDSTIEKIKVDEIDLQFAKQKNFDIELSGLGVQSAYGTEINLPDHLKSPEDLARPPVFIVPALSGDLYGIEPLMKELALQGRRVVSLAYPESFLGKTTEEFVKAVENSPSYDPHTTYFKKAIKKMIGEEGDLELWGYSTGCPIVAEILSDPAFQNRTKNAVIISPLSVVDQSPIEFRLGVLGEASRLLGMQHGWKTSDVAIVRGAQESLDEGNMKRRKRASNALIRKIIKKMEIWKDTRVQQDGKIILLSAQKDAITKSHKSLRDFLELKQYKFVNLKKGSHLSPLTKARYVVRKILEIENKDDFNSEFSGYVEI